VYATLETEPLSEITSGKLSDLRAVREQEVSPATVNREFALIRAVLARAAKSWKWISIAPQVPMAMIEQHDPRWLTRPQFKELLKHLPTHAAELARFAVATGIRRSNVTGLTWDRVDMEGGFAFIPGSQAKGKRGIPVPLNADALGVLQRQLGRHPVYVFVFRGVPVYQVTTRAWREACIKAGVPGLRFHDLRHTWASWQAQAGTPAYALREMGGWATDAMVKKYVHLGASDLAQYAGRTLLKVGTPEKKPKARRAK
jgi:integrase